MNEQTALDELVVRAQTGDHEAYQTIVQRFQAMALSCAYSLLGDHQLAEDARQEAFIAAWCDLYNLRDPAAFPGWFRRIVVNHSIKFRRRRRILTVPLEDAVQIAAPQPGPAEVARRKDLMAQVTRAIAQLPAHEQEVVRLFYLDDLPLKEIGRRISLPVQTINNRLFAGRARLRQRLVEMVKHSVRAQSRTGDHRPRQAASLTAIELFDRQLEELLKSPTERRAQLVADQCQAGRLLCGRGRLLRFLGRMDEAFASFRQGLELPELRRDPVWRARLRTELGITHLQTADYAAARKELLAARGLIKTAGQCAESPASEPDTLRAVILNGLGVCAWGGGTFTRARQFYEASLAVSRALPCAELEAEALNNLALLHWKAGRLGEALDCFRASLRQWKRLKNRYGHALTLMNIGIIEETLGRTTLARRHYGDSLALAGEINFIQVRAAASSNLGNLALNQGQWAEALEYNRQALVLARDIGDRRSQAIALENIALAYLGLGQDQESQGELRDARRIARAIGDEERLFSLELVEIEAMLERNELTEIANRLEQLRQVLEKKGYHAELPRLLRLKAGGELRDGQVKAARKTLAQALRECHKQRNRPEEERLLAIGKSIAK